MQTSADDFWKRLLQTFKVEAADHLKEITSGLIALEKAPDAADRAHNLEVVYRETHSLKGAARAVDAAQIEEVCQPLESLMSALKRQQLESSPELFDLLHQAVDTLRELLLILDADPASSPRPHLGQLIGRLKGALNGESFFPSEIVEHEPADYPLPEAIDLEEAVAEPAPVDPPLPTVIAEPEPVAEPAPIAEKEPVDPPLPRAKAYRAPKVEKALVSETIRISNAKLNGVLVQAEELLSVKLAAGQRAMELGQVYHRMATWDKEWSRFRAGWRAPERTTDGNGSPSSGPHSSRLAEFLEWNREFVESLKQSLAGLAQATDRDQQAAGAMVDHLLQETKELLMLPFSTLLGVLPKSIRDLSRDQGKEVELVIHGEELEIDRRILEEMKDPLIHLVRNSLDHGIEKPDDRMRRGKPSYGTILIDISRRNGSEVELLISDDGQGLSAARVKSTAVKLGLIAQDEAETLSEQEVLSLVYQSGVSTSPIITDLSGRGLGLAIVKEKVEKLNGSISLETRVGEGTTFRISLPLKLATFRGVLIRVGEELFIAPVQHVERAMRVAAEQIKTVESMETVQLHGQPVALVRLRQVLELRQAGASREAPNRLPLVVLSWAGKRIAFLVDEVLSEQEVMVKSLNRPLVRVRNIAGVAILGTGRLVPVLNVSDLIKSAVRIGAPAPISAADSESQSEGQKKSVLVAEDSITARSLVKNILESAGYEVETAVDGVDAFTKLRGGRFNLLVSDVEMPRLDGLGLTAKVRGDRELSALPVILVTALGSREDRERGIEVGANAYIVKSSFDQGNLLEVIQRLI
ncbi:MAG TPA: hybrid sensor histidine kinase/response regulator [Blastocatellia bacterium]|nr:hybrid sensor histidine kinase/response regulator [Blastocatellia bacterium]